MCVQLIIFVSGNVRPLGPVREIVHTCFVFFRREKEVGWGPSEEIGGRDSPEGERRDDLGPVDNAPRQNGTGTLILEESRSPSKKDE